MACDETRRLSKAWHLLSRRLLVGHGAHIKRHHSPIIHNTAGLDLPWLRWNIPSVFYWIKEDIPDVFIFTFDPFSFFYSNICFNFNSILRHNIRQRHILVKMKKQEVGGMKCDPQSHVLLKRVPSLCCRKLIGKLAHLSIPTDCVQERFLHWW